MALPRVTQLNIVQGSAQEEGPYTHVHALPGEGEPAYLFLLFEAKGPTPEATCAGAAETFLQTFSETRRSVTGRLVEALRTVHEALLWENNHSLQEHQTTLGAVCLYLKGSDLYLAHAGPTLAYVIGPGGGRHLAPAPGGPAPQLGSPREPPVWVRHHHLAPEESILLASSDLAQSGNERELFGAFQQGLEEGMVAVYRRSQMERGFAALGVDPGVGKSKAVAGAAPGTTPSVRGAEGRPPPQPGAFPRPAYTYGRSQAPYPFPSHAAAPEVPLGFGANLSLKLREPRHWVRGSLLNLFPPRLLIGLAAVFLMGGLFLGARATIQRVERQGFVEAGQLVQAAQEMESQAQKAPTADARRQIYSQALEQLRKAQRQDPTNTEATALLNRIQATLTRLDAAYELTTLRTLVDFATYTGTTTLIRGLVYRGDGFYILDKSGDRIFQVPLPDPRDQGQSPIPTTLLQPQGNARRNLVSLVWMPQGGSWPRDSLLALDSNRGL
ncbi:MAG TPA: hypothetical protein VJA25_11270, partial [Dehalococcoidia bacterium]|nr:hypothetical protein [Dehalococcoidia bacterium]